MVNLGRSQTFTLVYKNSYKYCKMCLKSPGTDVGAAGFERCPRTFETHFSSGQI